MSAETADVHVHRLLLTDTNLDLAVMAVTIETERTGVA